MLLLEAVRPDLSVSGGIARLFREDKGILWLSICVRKRYQVHSRSPLLQKKGRRMELFSGNAQKNWKNNPTHSQSPFCLQKAFA